MFRLLVGFAAGYWVASRRAAGQPVLPPDAAAVVNQFTQRVAGDALPKIVSSKQLSGLLRGWSW